jgi:hypothetical protein
MNFVALITYFLTISGELVFNAVEKYRFSRKLAHWNLHFTESRKEISVHYFDIDCSI